MRQKVVAGIDIGGTKIALAIQDRNRKVLSTQKIPTRVELGPSKILRDICDSLSQMIAEFDAELGAIGLCTPGPIDIEKGLVLSPTNLADWIEFPIVELLKKEFKVPVVFDNDANAAALGEYFYDGGESYKTILYVTVSTGVGGAIVINGKVHHGLATGAGEIGHMIVEPDGTVCGCGAKGCLEAVASGTAIAKRAKEAVDRNGGKLSGISVEKITAETVVDAVRKGDKIALEVWDNAVKLLAIGIGNAITTVAPNAVIIGGGISNAGNILFEPLRKRLNENVHLVPMEKVSVFAARLGGESGVFGALVLARQALDDLDWVVED